MLPSIARDLEASTRDLPLVGYLFSCDWHGVRVQRSVLLARLAAAGLSQYAPPPVSYQVSLHRALRAWIAERAAAGERAGLGNQNGLVAEDEPGSGAATRSLVRVARTSRSEWILFAVVQEAVDLAALDLDYATDLRVLVHKATGRLVVTTEATGVVDDQAAAPPVARRIADQLRPHWERCQDLHTAGDLGELTRAALRDLRAVNVQAGSGWYFVPLAQAPALRHLRDQIDRLPSVNEARPATLLLGQLDTAATRKQLAQAAYRDFIAQLGAARQDLATFTARPEGTVRAATIAARLAAYKELKARAELYASLLGMQQEAVQQALAELTEQAQAIVTRATGGDDPAPAPATLPLPGLVATGAGRR